MRIASLAVLYSSFYCGAQESRDFIRGRVGNNERRGELLRPVLFPGEETVTAELTGFKKFVASEVKVHVTEQVNLDISLTLGNVSESVEATAQTPLHSPAEAPAGQVVDERHAVELPLLAGNAIDLVHLAPGTVNDTNLRLRKTPLNNAPTSSRSTALPTPTRTARNRVLLAA